MGLSDKQHADLQRKMSPPTPVTDHPANVVECSTIGNEERLRGIPAVGRVSGTIKGTRPGDPSYQLEQAARELHASLMRRARQQLRSDKP